MLQGRLASIHGLQFVATNCNVPKHIAIYWRRKFQDPNWKKESHGGRRRGFTVAQLEAIYGLMREIVYSQPATPYRTYSRHMMECLGLSVSTSWIQKAFHDINWTYVPLFLSAGVLAEFA